MRTPGELVFERYLGEHYPNSFEFEKVQNGKRKRPDYTLTLDLEYVFDVKDCESELVDCRYLDPYAWIREQIEQGRRKFKEYKGSPCCVVMFSTGIWTPFLSDPMFMFGAMYGDRAISVPVCANGVGTYGGDGKVVFQDRGKMLRPNGGQPQNTTISALITLRQVTIGQARLRNRIRASSGPGEDWRNLAWMSGIDFDVSETALGVVVWENALAAVPLPRELFCGSFDERWAIDDGIVTRIHVGEGSAEYDRLLSRSG